MNIHFSRHARRRMRLYKITENVVINIVENAGLSLGKQTFLHESAGQKLPVKIVAVVEETVTTIVTVYPLKKGLPS